MRSFCEPSAPRPRRAVNSAAAVLVALCVTLSGCALFKHDSAKTPVPEAPPPPPPLDPLAQSMHRFEYDPATQDMVGAVQVTRTSADDTLPDLARRFNLGYEEIVRANPGVDPWLPGAGTQIVLPTRFALPNAPREGVVVNVASMRFFYFPKRKKGEPAVVYTHPVGIGKVGWVTPEGTTKILKRTLEPKWFVPASVRKEHLENGEELPAVVPAGPDNPLGRHSFTLGWPSYLIHGTNKPYGVGMRASHGCVRMYPEDIEQMFDMIPIGTQVRVVNQPFVFARNGSDVTLQAFGVMEDDKRDWEKSHRKLLDKTLTAAIRKQLKDSGQAIDWERVEALAAQPRGVPVSVVAPDASVEQVIATAERVRNALPEGSNWDGKEAVTAPKEASAAAEVVN